MERRLNALLCRLLGHHPGSHQMDTSFREYSRCRRCGRALTQQGGHWIAEE
jgi:hypothetical protein